MKKAFLKCLALVTIALSTTAFAQKNEANVTIQPLEQALQARTAAVHAKAGAGIGYDTYILVINYDDPNGIQVLFPTGLVKLGQSTAGRYQVPNFTGNSYIQLFNAYGQSFWSGWAQYQDIFSVYIRNGQYVVYQTH